MTKVIESYIISEMQRKDPLGHFIKHYGVCERIKSEIRNVTVRKTILNSMTNLHWEWAEKSSLITRYISTYSVYCRRREAKSREEIWQREWFCDYITDVWQLKWTHTHKIMFWFTQKMPVKGGEDTSSQNKCLEKIKMIIAMWVNLEIFRRLWEKEGGIQEKKKTGHTH